MLPQLYATRLVWFGLVAGVQLKARERGRIYPSPGAFVCVLVAVATFLLSHT